MNLLSDLLYGHIMINPLKEVYLILFNVILLYETNLYKYPIKDILSMIMKAHTNIYKMETESEHCLCTL